MREALNKLKNEYESLIEKYFGKKVPIVFGDGNINSPIVLVGEAPGRQEVEQGKPFVGQAGKNLDEFINILEISRECLYITNTVKFRPIKINSDTGRESNRPPTKEEISMSSVFLEKELSLIKPKIVVSLGNVPLKCITKNDKAAIGDMHGKPVKMIFGDSEFVLFPLYHPASIIYRAELKPVYIEDLYKLKEYLKSINN